MGHSGQSAEGRCSHFGSIYQFLAQFGNIWPSLGTFGSIWECMCWGRPSWRRKAAPLLPRSCIALHHPPLNPLHHPPPFYKLHREFFTLPYSITDCSRPLKAGGGGGGGGPPPLQPDRFYLVKILTHFVHYKMAK